MTEADFSEKDVAEFRKGVLKRSLLKVELKPRTQGKGRVFMSIDRRENRNALRCMLDRFGARLGTISGVDYGDSLGVVYHIILDRHGIVANLKVTDLPRGSPEVDTVSDIVPGAAFMEMEVHDLFGIEFKGNPYKRKWIISDDWPEGEYPLRKDYPQGG
ncbi:MAG: NADH-quinone oxidoreductase subunit C [Candidatus Bathyarchaeia archaeon]